MNTATTNENHTPSRSLGLQGATNFRDLGGYLGADGRRVVWRQLFRSDNLSRLSPEDQQAVRSLQVQNSYDFRGTNERANAPYQVSGITQHNLAIEPTVVQRLQEMAAAGSAITPTMAVTLMQETYRNFVANNSDRFARLMRELLTRETPLVFHCTAGKDRTGFAATLILHALGVHHDDIMSDYLLTNTHYQRPDTPHTTHTPIEALRVIWQVQPEFLQAALHEVNTHWGSLDNYLTRALGVGPHERELLRNRYLA